MEETSGCGEKDWGCAQNELNINYCSTKDVVISQICEVNSPSMVVPCNQDVLKSAELNIYGRMR